MLILTCSNCNFNAMLCFLLGFPLSTAGSSPFTSASANRMIADLIIINADIDKVCTTMKSVQGRISDIIDILAKV